MRQESPKSVRRLFEARPLITTVSVLSLAAATVALAGCSSNSQESHKQAVTAKHRARRVNLKQIEEHDVIPVASTNQTTTTSTTLPKPPSPSTTTTTGLPSTTTTTEAPPVIATTTTTTTTLPPIPSGAGISRDDYYYYYVGGQQTAAVNGVSANIEGANPYLAPTDLHSDVEMSIQSTNQANTVELGWTKDPSDNGNDNPDLFSGAWVNGVFQGYNSATLIPDSAGIEPGIAVTSGQTSTYEIDYSTSYDGWVISDNGTAFAYYPESMWTSSGTSFTPNDGQELISIFGEVTSSSANQPCSEMGNGTFGSQSGSLAISAFNLIGTNTTPDLDIFSTSGVELYNFGNIQSNSSGFGFSLGGPGAGPLAGCN